MSVTHGTAIRNSICNLVVDALDQGSGPGKLVLMTSGDVVVATLTLSKPAFSNADNGAAIANAVTSLPDAIGGVVAKLKATDSTGTTIFAGSVGLAGSGADVIVTNTTIEPNETVAVNLFTYTAPL